MHTSLSAQHRPFLRRVLAGATIVSALFFAGCSSDVGSAKLKKLPKAASRDAILAAMGQGPLAATSPADQPRVINGFRYQIFLWEGTKWELVWYRDDPGMLSDVITKEHDTPVLIESDTLVLWGWKKFTPFAAKHNLPNPIMDRARADSIMKSQNPDKK